MKKIGITVLLILNLFLLTNCNKEEKKEENKNELQTEVQVTKEELTEKEKEIIQKFDKESLEKFAENKKKIIEKLKKATTKEEGNKIYQESLEDIDSLMDNLNSKHKNILEEDAIKEEDLQIMNKILKAYDLKVRYYSEDEIFYIYLVPSFFYDIFKDYVTDDDKEYFKIIAKENEEIYSVNESIRITFKELGDRIITWENFLKKYPNSDFNPYVEKICFLYRKDYILGREDTPTRIGGYDGKPYRIAQENMEEFNRFMKKYPDSPTVKVIDYFLENYENKNIFEEIKKELEKIRKNN